MLGKNGNILEVEHVCLCMCARVGEGNSFTADEDVSSSRTAVATKPHFTVFAFGAPGMPSRKKSLLARDTRGLLLYSTVE